MRDVNLLHIAIWVFGFMVVGMGMTYWEFHKLNEDWKKEQKKKSKKK